MSDIFLSYAREDRERVRPLSEALAKGGWSVFWDRIIPVGKTWPEVLDAELAATRSLVVVWSQNSIKSKWVREEADEGLYLNLPLFPVLLDAIRPPLGFRSMQAADLSAWDGTVTSPLFLSLVRDIQNRLGKPGKPEALEPTAPESELEPVKPESPAKSAEPATKTEVTPENFKAHLWVETDPLDALVTILNLQAEFSQGQELEPGNYHLEMSANGWESQRKWVELKTGEDKHLKITLSKIEVPVEATPRVAKIKSPPREPAKSPPQHGCRDGGPQTRPTASGQRHVSYKATPS